MDSKSKLTDWLSAGNRSQLFIQWLELCLTVRVTELVASCADKDTDFIRKKYGHYEAFQQVYEAFKCLDNDANKFAVEYLEQKPEEEENK